MGPMANENGKTIDIGVIWDSACRLAEQRCFLQTQHASLHKDMKAEQTLTIFCQGWEWDLCLVCIIWSKISQDQEKKPPLMTVGLVQLSFVICYAPGGLENVAKAEWADSMVVTETTLRDSSIQHEIHLTKDRYCLTCHLTLKISVEKLTLLEGSSSR